MSEEYAREVLRRNVAQICQTIGWNGINSTPLDILVHILEKYIRTLGTQASRFAEQFERTEPNLHDLGLVFRDLHIQLPELAEYTRSVPPVPPPVVVERFPKPKESHLNFLKPGSHEVVTRPIHVHEHLPPMYPEKERETPVVADTIEIRQNGIDTVSTSNATCNSPEISVTDSPEKPKDPFKRPIDPVSLPNSKKPRLRLEEEERTREISSVMMTMSGFLSPAREGKLPEAKAPTIVSERHHEKHKSNLHPNLMKVPTHPSLDKSDKKSKKSSKVVNGKIMKSKRRDKSHKGDSKSKEGREKHPLGHPTKSKLVDPGIHNHVTMPAPKVLPPNKPMLPPVVPPPMEMLNPVIKQEPPDLPPPIRKNQPLREDSIPVPRRIPISKSPLVATAVNKHANPILPPAAIKKEIVDEEEKLASQPDRSKVNIFKRISNKSKEDKMSPLEVAEKSHNASISRVDVDSEKSYEHVRVKTENSVVNNNDNSALDVMDLTTNEVISLDEDSFDMSPMPMRLDQRPSPLTINRSLEMPYPKDVPIPGVSPKIKKEKKHKEKKDKVAKQEAKLLKRQQQQLAFEMAQAQKQSMKLANPPKAKRPKTAKMAQMHPGFPFFPNMPAAGMMSGPGLIPNHGLIPGGDFLANLANNPALRGLAPPNLLNNPFGLAGGPGLIPGLMPGGLGPGLPNPMMPMGNYGHSSRSSSSKFPTMLRRPSLEVIAVDNDDDRGLKSPKERHDKHKSQTIPNILQKHKKSHKEHSKNMMKMPPIHPDITIELNPPKKVEPQREPPRQPLSPPPAPARCPTPEPIRVPAPAPIPIAAPSPVLSEGKDSDKSEKKKDKSHKKDKKDKDGLKIKKKKDKKDKSKDKSEKKKDKEEKSEVKEVKEKIKKEKKEKKKDKALDGIVPKLTLKLGSGSPMPPSSPDVFKLNIKPVVKKEDDEDTSARDEPVSREHSRSPELAQFSALVTRPPKPKHSKHNHTEEPKSPPATSSSPPRKNRPPSGHKFKRILFKSLKKGHVDNFDEGMETEELEQPPPPAEKPTGPLPTPYYVDEHGHKIWVCPACGRPDNGSPMIGCDGCDGWYHWVCVGITEEPGATEDWFCKSCTAKRAAMVFAGIPSKKRGRKPKGEKVRD